MTTNRSMSDRLKVLEKILDERDTTKRLTMKKNVKPPVEDVNLMKAIRNDIRAIKSDRDAHAVTSRVFHHAVAGALSDADRNFYVLMIEMNRRGVKLAARLEAIEDRLDALEGRRLLS